MVNEAGQFQQLNPVWEQVTAQPGTADGGAAAGVHASLRRRSDTANAGRRRRYRKQRNVGEPSAKRRGIVSLDQLDASRIANERLIYLVGRDVTERRKQEQRFHGLLESAPDALIVIDETARIVFANGQAHRIFGYEPGELVGEPIEVVVPERFREDHPAKVRRFIEDGRIRPMAAGLELYGRRKDGTEFPAEVSLSPVQTDAGLLVCSAVRDVTDRRRAQRLCEALLESAPDAMIVATAAGTIRFANLEALRLFGFTREQLIGQPIDVLLPMNIREHHPELFAQFIAHPSVRRMGSGQTLHGRHADGSEFAIEVSLSPIPTDEGLLISSALRAPIECQVGC